MSDDFYRKFENRHRGSVEDIKSRVAVYLPFIEILAQTYPETQVADLGCGRGEWLELLKDKAIPAVGVDLDEGMLAVWDGQAYYGADAVSLLARLADPSDVFNRLHQWLNARPKMARLFYPLFKRARRVALALKGCGPLVRS